MSDYFDASANRLSDGTIARTRDVNILRDEVGSGFDLLPDIDNINKGLLSYCSVGGTADVITLTRTETLAAYADGVQVLFQASGDNTGAVTVNVDSLGAKSLVSVKGNALEAGDLTSGSFFTAVYNATSGKFQLLQVSDAELDAYLTAAAASAAAALASETAAGASETAAAASEAAAGASETAAAASETAAAASETAAETALDTFTDIWLGVKASDPSTDNDGDPLAAGMFYHNSTSNLSRVYDGSQWYDVTKGAYTFTSTAINKTLVNLERTTVTASTKTITLPASPDAGYECWVTVGNFIDTEVAGNGETINGSGSNYTISSANAVVGFVYSGSDWTAYLVSPGGVTNLDWDIKTGAYTAVNNDALAVNTTSSAFTITLPAGPSANDQVYFTDYARTWPTNNMTIGRNGSNIEGVAEDLVCGLSRTFALVYIDATAGWKIR
jgi:hypothetical protein